MYRTCDMSGSGATTPQLHRIWAICTAQDAVLLVQHPVLVTLKRQRSLDDELSEMWFPDLCRDECLRLLWLSIDISGPSNAQLTVADTVARWDASRAAICTTDQSGAISTIATDSGLSVPNSGVAAGFP